MIKYLFVSLLFIFPFNFQEHWRCLDEGLYDLISTPINTKICKYNQILTKDNVKVKIDNKATLVLTQRDIKNGNYILFAKKKYIINDKLSKNGINYNYYVLGMESFKNKEGTFYLLELSTSNGLNLNSKTFNLIILFSKNKLYIPFTEWDSGEGGATSIGINKGKLFVLTNDIDSIQYFEYKNKKFIYNSKNSIKCRIDSTRRICVPDSYRF
ncbi:hypothetical protein [Flavobacterium reichenbachii]|uniref:Uncharacterized protein n=1 Tax=Flavobacterium reichenbachii TaxID=362418 RepID=A0A085ZDU2_9FLAO|nr:hypothetical protein [Flavobacterium reichenbachii]KFF02606.1 hypothetical protein IW19_23335 [Flavobacterium reichenbachii]OXB17209.1 hypothetical protein B0A68_05305 [Flavobacterium reichenbachii]